MKILGFHVVRELPEPEEKVVEVPVPVPGPASLVKAWEVDAEPAPSYGFAPFRWVKEYFSDCVQANKAHPGKDGRQVELLQIGDRYFKVAGSLKEVALTKRQPARKKKG